MEIQKLAQIFLLAILLVTLRMTNAGAHGGGLDSQGGHNNRKTGGYHYHRGPMAGQSSASKTEAAAAPNEKISGSDTGQAGKISRPSAGPIAKHLVGVASVIDGDTIEIHGQRIRLHGIDAPESSQTCSEGGKAIRCGAIAANRLAEKIGGRTVTCDERDKDRYGRVVSVCTVGGQDLNAWMVSEGLAVAYRKYSTDYVEHEKDAQGTKRGVWNTEFEMPWDWRRK